MKSAPGAVPIYQGNDFYVPAFEVRVDRKEVTRDVIHDITQVTYRDDIEQIDSFEIAINNWDAATRTFKYSDEATFLPGKQVELRMGYFGAAHMRLMLSGVIRSLRPTFPSGGQPMLTISGVNRLDELRQRQNSRSFEGRSDHEIAQQVSQGLGMELKLDQNGAGATNRYDYLMQENQYDIMLLWRLARRTGYDLFVIENEGGEPQLYFGPSQNRTRPVYELRYGASLIEFTPTLITANQVASVTVNAQHPTSKERISVTVQRSEVNVGNVGGAKWQPMIQGFRRQEVISNQVVASEAEARLVAREAHERIAKSMLTGSGSTIGLPDLRAGSAVKITGLGESFSGIYFVTGTTHTIGDGGYTTQFECRHA
jgi:phage protein D